MTNAINTWVISTEQSLYCNARDVDLCMLEPCPLHTCAHVPTRNAYVLNHTPMAQWSIP